MTAIDRTIYRRMKRSCATKELIEAYTPPEESLISCISGTGTSHPHDLSVTLHLGHAIPRALHGSM